MTSANYSPVHLSSRECCGLPFDKLKDFEEVSMEEARVEYKDFTQAVHAMFYMCEDRLLWEKYPVRGAVMMQMRFDGLLGFPGGLLDSAGEDVVAAANRELAEEIALDLDKNKVTEEDHVATHLNRKKNLVTHFYAKQVTPDEFHTIEMKTFQAPDWAVETLGVLRVPLYTMADGYRGLPVFLSNNFAGNARQQLLLTLKRRNIIPEEELEEVEEAFKTYMLTRT